MRLVKKYNYTYIVKYYQPCDVFPHLPRLYKISGDRLMYWWDGSRWFRLNKSRTVSYLRACHNKVLDITIDEAKLMYPKAFV
jgi:hypothetical protein